MPKDLFDAVYDRRDSKREIQGISASANGSWVLYADQWAATGNAQFALDTVIRNRQKNGERIDHVRLGPRGAYILYSHGFVSVDNSNKLQLLEYSLGGKNIWRRMDELNVRGVTIAIVDGNEVVAARGYGLREWNTEKPVLAGTPFDVASLSKYISSLTAMRFMATTFPCWTQTSRPLRR